MHGPEKVSLPQHRAMKAFEDQLKNFESAIKMDREHYAAQLSCIQSSIKDMHSSMTAAAGYVPYQQVIISTTTIIIYGCDSQDDVMLLLYRCSSTNNKRLKPLLGLLLLLLMLVVVRHPTLAG
jgi:hypothetical protein